MSESRQSGYGIRADMLGMAIGILESRNSRLEQNEHFSAENSKSYQRKKIDPYTEEEVLLVAEKLYNFVEKK